MPGNGHTADMPAQPYTSLRRPASQKRGQLPSLGHFLIPVTDTHISVSTQNTLFWFLLGKGKVRGQGERAVGGSFSCSCS